jgi:hypothetical protein
MPLHGNFLVYQMLIPAVAMVFLVGSLASAAIGAGLIVSSARMFRLFGAMNSYVSTRHGLKPLAMPHDIGRSVHRHRRLIGALYVTGAAFSIYSLLAWYDGPTILAVLNLHYPRAFVAWILDSVRWCLIAFSMLAILTGVLLAFFPDALARFEAQANRWVSVRHLTIGVDKMHLPLDRLARAFPRVTGSILLVTALYVAANAAMLWFRFR